MKIALRFVLVLLIGAISACRSVTFNDVSQTKPYSEVIGMVATSRVELILHGWTEEDFTVKNPVFYSLSVPPGASNRFVKTRSSVSPGLKLKVVAVERCKDCYLDIEPRIRFTVILQNMKTKFDVPLYLDDSFLISDWGNSHAPIIYAKDSFDVGS